MSRPLQFLFGQFIPQCNHNISKYFDDYYVLQYMDGGDVDLQIETRSHHLQGRWFWSSYPGPRISFHASDPQKTWIHRYLAFRGPVVKRWLNVGLFPIAPQPSVADYSDRFDTLLELSRRPDRWGIARASLLMESILTELAESRVKPRTIPAWLERALAQINTLGAKIDYDRLALESGLPARTFRRRFTQAIGSSPQGYAISSRIGHARQMLGATELPIKVISQKLGYRDVFFFSRQFTRFTGVSPGAYRRTKEA